MILSHLPHKQENWHPESLRPFPTVMELVYSTAGQQSRPSLCDSKIHTPDHVALPLGSPTHLGVLLLGGAAQPSLATTEDASLGATGWP